jgi:Spy/CpxP family protein refolding chaperone
MRAFLCAVVGLGMAAMAQDSGNTSLSIMPYPMPVQAYQELKTYLTLTDTQVRALTDVFNRKMEADRVFYQQIGEKERALYELLNNNSNDALRIGQLMVEVNQLRKKAPSVEPYRTDALNVLTADQKAKLPALVNAMKLQSTGWQAISLNLIDSPQGEPRIMPAGGVFMDRNAAIGRASSVNAVRLP